MKKFFTICLICILSIGCLCGCGESTPEKKDTGEEITNQKSKSSIDPDLIGTWDEYGIPEEQRLGDYWVFDKKGSGKWGLMDVEFKYSAEDGRLVIDCDEGWGEYMYTYSINGDILTLTEEGSSANQYQKQ